jgi:hypothetical protein
VTHNWVGIFYERKLKSNGQQFHQYQQNEQSLLTEYKKSTTTYDVGNSGPALGQTQKWGGVKQVNEITILPSW